MMTNMSPLARELTPHSPVCKTCSREGRPFGSSGETVRIECQAFVARMTCWLTGLLLMLLLLLLLLLTSLVRILV